MQKFKSLADAVRIAEVGHFHQVDKAGLPYIDHPKRVLSTVQAMGAMPYVQIAAVLHDIPEDTSFSHDILLALGFSEAVVKLTKLLDRNYSEQRFLDDYPEHLGLDESDKYKELRDNYYYNGIALNPDAKMIKIADIRDNLAPWRLNYLDEETQDRLKAKYAKALKHLGE